jgi:hypothetical protein
MQEKSFIVWAVDAAPFIAGMELGYFHSSFQNFEFWSCTLVKNMEQRQKIKINVFKEKDIKTMVNT